MNQLGHPASQLWRASRPSSVKAITVMVLLASLSAALSAAAPMTAQAPVRLNAALAPTGLVLAACVWTFRWRGWPHVGLVITMGALGLLAANAATAAGTAALGTSFTWTAAYGAFFYSRAVARGYAAAGLTTFAAALYVNPFPGTVHVWLLTAMTATGGIEVISRLVARLDKAATTDPLTGLLNRTGLERAARPVLAQAARRNTDVSVVVMDLDGFKLVNDTAGHAAGDTLLCAITEHWRRSLRAGDVLARLGGDEFVLVLPDTRGAEALSLLQRAAFDSPAAWSAGVAPVATGSTLSETLLKADLDLYAVKASRRSLVTLISPQREKGALQASA